MLQRKHHALLFGLCMYAAVSGTSLAAPAGNTVEAPGQNDFPTLARVEFVMQCMQRHGGQNYDTLYPCVCSADHVAARMHYEDFAEAQTFTYLFSTAGERGGVFRDPERSDTLREQLEEAMTSAEAACFVKPGASRSPAKSKNDKR